MSSALARLGSRRTDELFVLLDRSARELAATLETLERIVHALPHDGGLLVDVRRSETAVRQTTREFSGRLRERFVVPAEPADLRMLATAIEALAIAQLVGGRDAARQAEDLRGYARAGDELIGKGLAELFAEAPDAALLVGWSDVYEHLGATLPHLHTIAEAFDAVRPPSR